MQWGGVPRYRNRIGETAVDAKHPGSWPVQSFKTIETHPPRFQVNHVENNTNPGYIFLNQRSNDKGIRKSYKIIPCIFTDRGELVWTIDASWSRGLSVQSYQGESSVLTYWSTDKAPSKKGFGWGSLTLLDSTYAQVHAICPHLGLRHRPGLEGAECEADLHETVLTEGNTILVTAYNLTTADLSSFGGPVEGWIYDCIAYELDRDTLDVLWKWSALEHIPLDASKTAEFHIESKKNSMKNAWDWFHLNSIQKTSSGYLLNSRHTFSAYFVAADSGDVLWTLNGETGGDFGPLPNGTVIAFAHHPRIVHTTPTSHTLSLFNNGFGKSMAKTPSLGLLLHLPLPPSSSPVRVLHHLGDLENPLYSIAGGNVQSLPAQQQQSPASPHHYLVGYGDVAVVQEWAVGDEAIGDQEREKPPVQKLMWEARFGHDDRQRQYRVERHEWVGTPAADPVVVTEAAWTESGECEYWKAFVSWNGATDVEAWEILTGREEKVGGKLQRRSGRVSKRGFETSFNVPEGVGCIQVGAVRGGEVIRTTARTCGL